MTPKNQKTLLRTIRIRQDVDKILRTDAGTKGLSVNMLVSQIFDKYCEWDRYAERFGFITIASGTFRSILEEIDDEKLSRIAASLGAEVLKAVTLFWFKKVDLQTFLDTISLYAKYSGLQVHETKVDANEYTIVFRHALGRKWSTYLRHFMSHAIQEAVRVFPQSEISENSVVMSFRLPSTAS
jgi:hypothetical protein